MANYKGGLIVFIIIFALIAFLIDNHVPVASFRVKLSDSVSVRISVHDNSTGFAKSVITNIKAMIECWRGF